jgi:hypothetical protein
VVLMGKVGEAADSVTGPAPTLINRPEKITKRFSTFYSLSLAPGGLVARCGRRPLQDLSGELNGERQSLRIVCPSYLGNPETACGETEHAERKSMRRDRACGETEHAEMPAYNTVCLARLVSSTSYMCVSSTMRQYG